MKIEKNVPMPAHGNSKYPLAQMEVGDSFLVTDKKRNTVAGAASMYAKYNGGKFSTRVVDGSVRVWRIA